ncbi:esterase-like activity of phytase family protein [Hasllibacter halocynthiae]|uniref:esterase-like activity of phytase family protein n=1 Tax=Hasllibacter halocynthiae TaxID=595589 RepID=UPI001304BC6A|nr:esterase-like activity of phytase family protein [Hasllibacter halocynthiae]
MPVEVGGASGIELEAPGQDAVLLGDRGTLHELMIERDAAGDPVAARVRASRPLLGRDGASMGRVDSEALARRADGRWYVAFEGGRPRVSTWAPGARPLDGPSAPLTAIDPAPGIARNEGFEALAATPAGVLAISEGSGADGRHPVRLWTGTGWTTLPALAAAPSGLRPTGADWGPDGRLYLLERRFGGLGFAARVRRFALGPDGLTGGETVLDLPLGLHGNLEGIAAWRDAEGAVRLTLVSDDNFLPFQRAQIVEYVLEG